MPRVAQVRATCRSHGHRVVCHSRKNLTKLQTYESPRESQAPSLLLLLLLLSSSATSTATRTAEYQVARPNHQCAYRCSCFATDRLLFLTLLALFLFYLLWSFLLVCVCVFFFLFYARWLLSIGDESSSSSIDDLPLSLSLSCSLSCYTTHVCGRASNQLAEAWYVRSSWSMARLQEG